MSHPQLAAWFASFAVNHPDVYSATDLSKIWYWSHDQLEKLGEETKAEKHRALVGYLRAGLLKRLRTAVGQCKKCPLHEYRLPGRPVLDDADWEADPFAEYPGEKAAPIGAVHAETVIVSEGPGEFEQRTGVPFVSWPVLVGSICARGCGNFETCYPRPGKPKRLGGKVIYTPAAPCNVEPLRKAVKKELLGGASVEEGTALLDPIPEQVEERLLQIQTERANQKSWDIGTVAFFLDKALRKAGFWRAGWNSQARLWQGEKPRQAREPDVYICNTVKCRSCVPDEHASDGLKDRAPTKEHIEACDPWLRIQLEILQPRLIVALGNAAAAAILGKPVQITKVRGSFETAPDGTPVLLEVHPSWISRQHDPENPERQQLAFEGLIDSFQKAKQFLSGAFGPASRDEDTAVSAGLVEESPFAEETTPALQTAPEPAINADEGARAAEAQRERPAEDLPEGRFDNASKAQFIPSFEEDQIGAGEP